MTALKFLVIEYIPHLMHGHKMTPARIDGQYTSLYGETVTSAVVEPTEPVRQPPKLSA